MRPVPSLQRITWSTRQDAMQDTKPTDPQRDAALPAAPEVPAAPPASPTDSVADAQPADPAPDLLDLLRKAEGEVEELRNDWLRARADVENIRRQAAADVGKAHRFAIEKFATDLLPVKDALEQTLAAASASPDQLRAGVELTLRQLEAAFGRAQVSAIEPDGEKFDPHRHQAMQLVEAGQDPNTVVQVLQKGYALNERVLRPALVTVAKGA